LSFIEFIKRKGANMSRISTTATSQKVSGTSSSARVDESGKNTARSPKPMGGGAERNQMIATAAYYRAERRGFTGGNPVGDWLAAEAEIDQLYH
jgi:Protein of unknown function (DUF2934)